ncbi:MAG: hypothetical protein SOX82_09270 [Eubacteriales bacterium]|nr:hypothetical protein [Eubacteriales bacterium]
MLRDEFKNAVDTNHKTAIYVMLKNSLTNDTSFREFNEMAAYAEGKIDLYQNHDGEVLSNDPAHWTKDYMNQQLAHLVNNFSHERVDLLKRICRKIYGCPGDKNGSAAKSDETSKAGTTQKTGHSISRRKLGTGAAIAGGVTAIAGAVTAHTAVAIAGVAVAAVGFAVVVADK